MNLNPLSFIIALMDELRSVNIKVAGMPCRLIIDDESLFDYFSKNYFTDKKVSKPKIIIKILKNSGGYTITSTPKIITLDVKGKRIARLFNIVDWTVRIVIHYNLVKYKIIFIHCSSFVDNGNVYAFAGFSGKGKSTAIGNFPKRMVVGDDILVLKKVGKSFVAFQSPFEKKKVKSMGHLKAPIKKIFFLNWAKDLFQESIGPIDAVSLLLRDGIMRRIPEVKFDLYPSLTIDLIKSVSFKKLSFPKKFSYRYFLQRYG